MDRVDLQEQFLKLLLRFEFGVRLLPTEEEREIGAKWLQKLTHLQGNVYMLQLRNDFLSYLGRTMANGSLGCSPFNVTPIGCLSKWKKYLPENYRWIHTVPAKQSKVLHEMFTMSEAACEFLRRQPVPKHGTFAVFYVYRGLIDDAQNSCHPRDPNRVQPCDNQQDCNQQDCK